MQDKRIVLVAGKWDTTPIVYNFLAENFVIKKVIIEDPVPKKEFLKKRIRKLGWFEVGGQVLFQLLVSKILAKTSKKRIKEILNLYQLKTAAIPESVIVYVPSVNSTECLEQLKNFQPDLVIVHGTRIISKKVLESIHAAFINIHAGITPRYRGSHGAYWALANDDKENCGVTVHLVDAGIDTGNILVQEKIPLTPKDNFITYGYLQLAVGLNLLKQAIEDASSIEKLQTKKSELNSALWHHPTLWRYLYNRFRKGIK